jgi:hypothetical protein
MLAVIFATFPVARKGGFLCPLAAEGVIERAEISADQCANLQNDAGMSRGVACLRSIIFGKVSLAISAKASEANLHRLA